MQALVMHAPGDLRVEDFPTAELGAGQLRVRVRCGGICGSDLHYYQHGGFGTIRVKEPMALGHEVAGKGGFDVLFEASGNERALREALDAPRPRGITVQVGLGGEMTLPVNTLVANEFDLRDAFRFHEEFAIAVELLNKGLVDVKPLISATLSYRGSARAFTLAADRSQAMKVLLNFD